MPGNGAANINKSGTAREPDNIIRSQRDGTTYTVREFMVGSEPVIDIVTRRVKRELEPEFPIL